MLVKMWGKELFYTADKMYTSVETMEIGLEVSQNTKNIK